MTIDSTMPEFLDIVNKSDQVIGVATREEVYQKLLCYRIAHVLVFNTRNEMLLQLRSKAVSFCPLYWCTAAGGHVQSGETYEQAALREYQEELGTTSPLKLLGVDYYQAPIGHPSKFLGIFTTTHNGPFNLDKDAIDRVEFFAIDKIKALVNCGEQFHPELLFILQKHYF